jgi:hypothetical protein
MSFSQNLIQICAHGHPYIGGFDQHGLGRGTVQGYIAGTQAARG